MKAMEKFCCVIVLAMLLASCATRQSQEWRAIEEGGQKNITLSMPGQNLVRTSAETRGFGSGWAEIGDWNNGGGDSSLQVRIIVYSLSNSAFSNKNRDDIEDTVRSVSGDGYLVLGEKNNIPTRTGMVDYQFYTVSGLTCFLVENYWFDPITFTYDGFRDGSLNEYIIGNSLLQAYYCDENRKVLNLADVEKFLHSIHVDDIYWPEQRFTRFDNWEKSSSLE